MAHQISSVRLDPTAERPFRAVKTTAAAGALENPSAFAPALSLSSSPHSLFSLQRSVAATESERRRASGRWSEPWRRRRPPRRRACSPTGEHAAVERPGRGAPGSSLLLPRRRKAVPALLFPRRRGWIRPLPFLLSHPLLFDLDLSFLLSEPNRRRGLGLGFFDSFLFFSLISFVSSRIQPVRDEDPSRVRFRVRMPTLFFSPFFSVFPIFSLTSEWI